MHGRVLQRFRDTDISILQLHIFSGYRNSYFPVIMLHNTGYHLMPAGHILFFQRHIQLLQHDVVHVLFFQQLGHLVNAFGRQVLNDRVLVHIAEQRQLCDHVLGHGMFAAAH